MYLEFFERLLQITPDPLFLLMAAGFLGVVLAFLIPVSIDIISKVAAKYNSDVVVRMFQSNLISKYFPYFVLLSIGAMLSMRFLAISEDIAASYPYQITMWVLLLFSVIITVLSGYLIYRLERVISDDDVPMRMLAEKVGNIFALSRGTVKERDRAVEYIEGIGDILLYQTRQANNRSAINGLTGLSTMILRLLRMNVHNKEKFEILVYSSELISIRKDNSPEATAVACFKNQNKHLGCLAAYVNQLERVYLAAHADNREVSRFALRAMHRALQQASTQPDNELVVELLLRKIVNCVNSSVRENYNLEEDCVSWYIDSVLRDPQSGNGSFQIPYLDLYDSHFIQIIQNIITSRNFVCFRESIGYMLENFNFPNYQREKLWGYHYLLRASDFNKYLAINREHRIQRRVRNLIEEEDQIYTIQQMREWLESFAELRKVIVDNLPGKAEKEKAKAIEEEIKENVIKHLKYTRLIRLSYAIGTLCTGEDKTDYIRYMRDAIRELERREQGLDMLPQNLQDLMDDYLIFYDLHTRHRIPRRDYRSYVFMMLRELIDKESANNFYFPFIKDEQVENGMQVLRGLFEAASEIVADEKLDDKQTKLGLNFLKSAVSELESSLKKQRSNIKISKKDRDLFQSNFTEGFKSRLVLRPVFADYLGAYKVRAKEKLKRLPHSPWGLNELTPKTNLIGSGERLNRVARQYGESLGDIENITLCNILIKHCAKKSIADLDTVIRLAGDPHDFLLLSTFSGVDKFLKQDEKFHMARYLDDAASYGLQDKKSEAELELAKINGFIGYYDINNLQVPVFNFYYRGAGSFILLLQKSKLGQLAQMPLTTHPPRKKKYLGLTREHIYFNIEDISTSPKLVKKYIADAPSWLTEVGDKEQQKDYLEQRVLITALENITLTPKAKTVGYYLDIGGRRRMSANLRP